MEVATKTLRDGKIHCMSCGRTLAEVAVDAAQGAVALKPTRYQSAVRVIVAGRQMLRCKHCKGRAFVEPFGESGKKYAGTGGLPVAERGFLNLRRAPLRLIVDR